MIAWDGLCVKYLPVHRVVSGFPWADSYRHAVEINPRDYRAWYGLGQTYELLARHGPTACYAQLPTAAPPRHPTRACYPDQCHPTARATREATRARLGSGVVCRSHCALRARRHTQAFTQPPPHTASPQCMPRYALHYFSRAAAVRPHDPRMWCAMGQCYEVEQARRATGGYPSVRERGSTAPQALRFALIAFHAAGCCCCLAAHRATKKRNKHGPQRKL